MPRACEPERSEGSHCAENNEVLRAAPLADADADFGHLIHIYQCYSYTLLINIKLHNQGDCIWMRRLYKAWCLKIRKY